MEEVDVQLPQVHFHLILFFDIEMIDLLEIHDQIQIVIQVNNPKVIHTQEGNR